MRKLNGTVREMKRSMKRKVRIPMKERIKYLVGGVWTMTLPSSLRNLRPDTSSPGWPWIPWIPWTLHLLHRLTFPYQAPFPLLALLWNQGRPAIEGRIGRWSC